jgi:Xaa-Pro aminopeptidase
MPILDPVRTADIERKHRLVREFLESHRYDALLLQKPSNFAWFTGGADCVLAGASASAAALFITSDARVLVTTNVDSAQFFDYELSSLGFQLKERPWHEPRHLLLDDLCRGRTVAGDGAYGSTDDASVYVSRMRSPLTVLDCERLREIARSVAHAIEATARHLRPGRTEAEVAGELAHRLMKRQVVPERIQVSGDGQRKRYRQWTYGTEPIERYCVISAIGRGGGLCAGASRTVSFGEPPSELREAHQHVVLLQATGMHFSRADWEVYEVWNRVQRIYEKFGHGDEWRLAPQAEVIGYEPAELAIVPRSEFQLAARTAIHWHPSVGPAASGDTVLITERGPELLTPTENWPKLTVQIKGVELARPDILRLDQMGETGADSVLAMTE